jgi:hypothetical protein
MPSSQLLRAQWLQCVMAYQFKGEAAFFALVPKPQINREKTAENRQIGYMRSHINMLKSFGASPA